MIVFVGVGPGDPELMTLKAVRMLREADVIVLPDSGMGESTVMKITGALTKAKPVHPLHIPMKGNRRDWEDAHDKAVKTMLELADQYDTVVYPVLGDPGIYASSSYLMAKLTGKHPCSVVPGVPAMCAMAAELGVPLCEQRESLTVCDSFTEGDTIPPGNVVIMKSGKSLESLQKAAQGRKAYAACNVGMENAWLGALDQIKLGNYSYFTTVIVKQYES